MLFTKLLLKPLEQLDKKISAQFHVNLSPTKGQGPAVDKDRMQMQPDVSASGEVSFLSDTEDNTNTDDN